MKMRIAFFMFLASGALFLAQAVNISGVVKNSAGSGIEGATVRLGKADIATTTGTDGSFKLTDNATGVKHQTNHTAFGNDRPFILEDNRFFFNAREQAQVTVRAYDCNGRLLFSQGKVASSRDHSIALPHFGSGIYIYHVSVNNERYTFKSVGGVTTNRGPTSSWEELALAKQLKATAKIDDALLFTKDGYQLYRIAVTKPDTSGIQIAMVPLVTGTVTDVDGNAYQTVRIGNQEWTAENLRTTKFNDNTTIGSGCNFYNNMTDAAAKKKWGALYEWSAVKTGKLAPKGWHVPTNADLDTLQNYLITHGYNYDGTTSGNKIAKSLCAKTDWPKDTVDTGAIGNDVSKNNASGFSALPAGWRDWNGNKFTNQGTNAYWWTASAKDGTYSYVYEFWCINNYLERTYMTLIECSVRLVRDN
jgi:uncharacterized protein (TIGR02145 family)